jgi:hypothetical protein
VRLAMCCRKKRVSPEYPVRSVQQPLEAARIAGGDFRFFAPFMT